VWLNCFPVEVVYNAGNRPVLQKDVLEIDADIVSTARRCRLRVGER
jgi:hypothetical protein